MTAPFPITIFHNPACGTSRNVLAMIRAAGYAPTVVEYLQVGWTAAQLRDLLAAMGARPRDILRAKAVPADRPELLDPVASDESLLDAMTKLPALVERPIVVTPRGVRLARPSEAVMALLDNPLAQFTKEDGEVVRFGPQGG